MPYFRVPALGYGKEILIGMRALLLGGMLAGDIFWHGRGFLLPVTEIIYFIAAMNILSLYHGKIIAPLVAKIRGLIEAQVILVLLQ